MNEYWMSESQGDLQNCDVATVLKIKKKHGKKHIIKKYVFYIVLMRQ